MTAGNTPLAVWERVLARGEGDIPPEAAGYLLRLDFAPADHARMDELNQGSAAGTLTPVERDELDGYVRVGHQLARLQSLARAALRRAAVTANGHG